MKSYTEMPPLNADDPTTDADKSIQLVKAFDEIDDPTRFTTRSFAVLWNEDHSVRLINLKDSRKAISIPWDEIPALRACLKRPVGGSPWKIVAGVIA
jgi:hypothetical protein